MIIPRAAEGLPPNPHGHELANVAIIMCVIAGVLVLGRLATRIFLQRSTGWDDYTLVASLVRRLKAFYDVADKTGPCNRHHSVLHPR